MLFENINIHKYLQRRQSLDIVVVVTDAFPAINHKVRCGLENCIVNIGL